MSIIKIFFLAKLCWRKLRNVAHPVGWYFSIPGSIKISVPPADRVNVFVCTGDVGGDKCRSSSTQKYFAFHEDRPAKRDIFLDAHTYRVRFAWGDARSFQQRRLLHPLARDDSRGSAANSCTYVDLDIGTTSCPFYTCRNQVLVYEEKKKKRGSQFRMTRWLRTRLYTRVSLLTVKRVA